MLTKVCSKCKKVIPYPLTYCSECKKKVDAEIEEAKRRSNRRYNKTRDKKYIRFYKSSDWKVLSSKYRQDKQYRCEICGHYATEVHHIKPIQTDEGWNKRLDYNNLKCLCVDCHNKVHKRFQRRRGKG